MFVKKKKPLTSNVMKICSTILELHIKLKGTFLQLFTVNMAKLTPPKEMSGGYYFKVKRKICRPGFFIGQFRMFLFTNIKICSPKFNLLEDLPVGHFNSTSLIMDQFSKMYSIIIPLPSYIFFLH
jgi:hypothetical protein